MDGAAKRDQNTAGISDDFYPVALDPNLLTDSGTIQSSDAFGAGNGYESWSSTRSDFSISRDMSTVSNSDTPIMGGEESFYPHLASFNAEDNQDDPFFNIFDMESLFSINHSEIDCSQTQFQPDAPDHAEGSNPFTPVAGGPLHRLPTNIIAGQGNPDFAMEGSNEDSTVCYGMLHSLDIKLMGDMTIAASGLQASHTRYQRFALVQQQNNVILKFQHDETEFGYLRSGDAKTIAEILSMPDIECEAMAQKSELVEVIGRAHKSSAAKVKIIINIYGPLREASRVGGKLSAGKLWLQRPVEPRPGITYDNPHFLHIDIDETVIQETDHGLSTAANSTTKLPQPGNEGVSTATTRAEQLRKMVEEVYKSVDNSRHLDMVEGGHRVTRKLLSHQQEALAFMLERESGHINERYRLWQEVTLDGKTQYRHKITKARRPVRPEEKGGGILADEMGMGKSLSILALAMKTLDDGVEWATQSRDDEESNKPQVKYSRSTLIVVSASLLITNWMKEIDKHLTGGLKVIKYHGAQRPTDTSVIQDSDIVITTYNTLALEYQKNKVQPAILHSIGWYRVVLDEAHIIRRPSGAFYQSCSSLRANSRWCLTGTPIQNKLADLGTLFAFLRAEPFNKASIFRKWIEVAYEHTSDNPTRVEERLVMLLEAFCLRRTKAVLDLPPLRQFVRKIEFNADEKRQYGKTESILMRNIQQRVGVDDKTSKFSLFHATLQLRILCNHGTFQQLFSWLRRSPRDEKDVFGSMRGNESEINCSGCQQPMPFQGSSWYDDMFDDQCAHVLCSECIEQSMSSWSNSQTRRCPVCAARHKQSLAHDTLSLPGMSKEAANTDETKVHPRISSSGDDEAFYFNESGHSTKMKTLIEDVSVDLWKTKRQVIIFSCWTRTLDLVARHLKRAHIPYRRIDGNTPLPERQLNLDRFADGEEDPVLIMTTGTGAYGLNLTCANRIFIVELQWNPSVEKQAIARAIRLGQTSEVRVMRYITRGTVEEGIWQQQQWKKQIAAVGFEEVPDVIDVDMQSPQC